MNFAMTRLKLGRDRTTGCVPHGRKSWPTVFLIAVPPVVATCDSLLDTAGVERKSKQETAAPETARWTDETLVGWVVNDGGR